MRLLCCLRLREKNGAESFISGPCLGLEGSQRQTSGASSGGDAIPGEVSLSAIVPPQIHPHEATFATEASGPGPRSVEIPADGQTGVTHRSTVTPRDSASDVVETNLHTGNLEFYGGSSSVAFLRRVESLSDHQTTGSLSGPAERSLASLLHNPDFRTTSRPYGTQGGGGGPLNSQRFYFRVARKFLDAYFSNIHNIQPLFDEELFLARCEDLWFNKPERQPLTFVALYLATLSLGSLVMVWEDRDMYGTDRFVWSRRLFNEALSILTQLGSATDVEMVQCYYMMSKVCQHELNPHVAYLYSGQAARTALAIGINRRPVDQSALDERTSTTASLTWWAVYCLDIQASFALGRPDSLGPDEYHTQTVPVALGSDEATLAPRSRMLQIVPCMVELSRIMRTVGLRLYTTPCTIDERIARARALNHTLESWLNRLPPQFHTEDQVAGESSLKRSRPQGYVGKQSVVLKLRCLNLRMIIHGVFMTPMDTISPNMEMAARECRQKCIDSASRAIDLMYDTFKADTFFQTWWYNSTYALFAVSILLTAVFHKFATSRHALDNLFTHVDRAIAVLQVMDECVVARNATSIIKRTLSRAKKVPQTALDGQNPLNAPDHVLPQPQWGVTDLPPSRDSTHLPLDADVGANTDYPIDEDLNWLEAFPFDDKQQALFWTEWAHELDTLGT